MRKSTVGRGLARKSFVVGIITTLSLGTTHHAYISERHPTHTEASAGTEARLIRGSKFEVGALFDGAPFTSREVESRQGRARVHILMGAEEFAGGHCVRALDANFGDVVRSRRGLTHFGEIAWVWVPLDDVLQCV